MLRRLVPVVAVALLLAGCSGDPAPAKEAPAKETTSSPESAARPTEAPAIAQPLDMGPGARHPCDTLTAAQQKQLGFPPQGKQSAGRCSWARDYTLELRVDFDALADAYQKSNDPEWAVFEPREIHGQPAVVRASSTRGNMCEVVVGMAPGQSVVMAGSTKPDPKLCDRLVAAAGLVVETLSRWAGV